MSSPLHRRDRPARPRHADHAQLHAARGAARHLGYLHRVHHAAAERICAAATRKSCGWRRSPNASASAATCTTCWATRCRWSRSSPSWRASSSTATSTRRAREISEVERVARDALSQVRNAVSRHPQHRAVGRAASPPPRCSRRRVVKVKCETENVKLPHDRETALALSLREAATNIRRHSGASGVTIRVKKEPTDSRRRSGRRRTRRTHRARQRTERHARAARQRRRLAVARRLTRTAARCCAPRCPVAA